ncbi:hypothetical protein HY491_02065 [Candidatus Woesearchaeota archaeon]|nr:hypothetical protein [Candidatus Woesearchaeota archaeon]
MVPHLTAEISRARDEDGQYDITLYYHPYAALSTFGRDFGHAVSAMEDALRAYLFDLKQSGISPEQLHKKPSPRIGELELAVEERRAAMRGVVPVRGLECPAFLPCDYDIQVVELLS